MAASEFIAFTNFLIEILLTMIYDKKLRHFQLRGIGELDQAYNLGSALMQRAR